MDRANSKFQASLRNASYVPLVLREVHSPLRPEETEALESPLPSEDSLASKIDKDMDWAREKLGEAQRSVLASAIGAMSRSVEAFL